jgi:hypothetical protein
MEQAMCECSLHYGFHSFSANTEVPTEDPLFHILQVIICKGIVLRGSLFFFYFIGKT